MIYTNDTYLNSTHPKAKPRLRLFEHVYEAEGYVWVKALNGHYEGEYLTFKKEHLREVNYDKHLFEVKNGKITNN